MAVVSENTLWPNYYIKLMALRLIEIDNQEKHAAEVLTNDIKEYSFSPM